MDTTFDFDEEEWRKKLEHHQMSRNDLHRLVMDYLCIEGFKEAAEKFAVESGVKPPMELDSMDDRIKVRDALENGRVEEATTLISERHPSLLDTDHTLYFRLQQQQLIELIRNRNVEEALNFAQDRLAECGVGDPSILAELERTLALLAFDDPEKSPFSDLLHLSHRQKVSGEVNSALLQSEHKGQDTPRLVRILKLILLFQDQLDKKKMHFPHMVDFANAKLEVPIASRRDSAGK